MMVPVPEPRPNAAVQYQHYFPTGKLSSRAIHARFAARLVHLTRDGEILGRTGQVVDQPSGEYAFQPFSRLTDGSIHAYNGRDSASARNRFPGVKSPGYLTLLVHVSMSILETSSYIVFSDMSLLDFRLFYLVPS